MHHESIKLKSTLHRIDVDPDPRPRVNREVYLDPKDVIVVSDAGYVRITLGTTRYLVRFSAKDTVKMLKRLIGACGVQARYHGHGEASREIKAESDALPRS